MKSIIFSLLLASGCATLGTGPTPCLHGGAALSLTVHTRDDITSLPPPPISTPAGLPPGWRMSMTPPTLAYVTLHNPTVTSRDVAMACGQVEAPSRFHVGVRAGEEITMSFAVPRGANMNYHFFCEIENDRIAEIQ